MRSHVFSFLGGLGFATVAFILSGTQSPGLAISSDVRRFLAAIEVVDLPIDSNGNTVEAFRLTGNLQIVNGTGSTFTTNASGNLLVGYMEPPAFGGSISRKGSHNIVCGVGNNHISTTYGCLVSGSDNTVDHAYDCVIGGVGNIARGHGSVVVGGSNNQANGLGSVVIGGNTNAASGERATVTGGKDNFAPSRYSSVSGGYQRMAFGEYNWAAGSLSEDF